MQLDIRSPVLLLLLPLLAAFALPACASEATVDDGDTGETEAAISTTSCALARQSILGKATGGRKIAIERAFGWFDSQVPYSQSAYRAGYRTDCSGFISMAWQLGTSYSTADFISGGAKSSLIGSYSNLAPGDALVHRSGGSGHIVLFLGWNDSSHSAACVLEEASTALDMQLRGRTTSSLQAGGYKAVRADSLKSTGSVPAGSDDPNNDEQAPGNDNDDNKDTGAASGTGGGQKCSGTGDCNPGNDGAGLICVAGTCKPGCLSSVQCPGSKSCVGGQCR